MKTATQKRKELRKLLSGENIVCVPGVGDALTAKVAQAAGIRCVADARIYSRVLEMCTPIQVRGGDRRQALGRDKQEVVRSVLFEETR